MIILSSESEYEMVDVSCVVNAHREGHVIHPTIQTVKLACAYAAECGLSTDVHVILDRPDKRTMNIVERELANVGEVHIVDFGDLAFSRNYSITQCKGEYVTFVDGDDLWCKSWIVDSYLCAQANDDATVLHPEFNIYFGSGDSHVFHHVDMTSPDFEFESFLKINYWTALSFAKREVYSSNPYHKNEILNGFGYEDWTWNYETIKKGLVHKIVPGTAHYIRKGKTGQSLLALTDSMNAIPRIMDLYESSGGAIGDKRCAIVAA